MPLESALLGPNAPPSYAAAFSVALTNPSLQTPIGVVGPNGKAAEKRYDVYRNNVTVSLIAALASIYPAVQRITGPDFFRGMARFHLRETPPKSPLLFEYGRDFPDFIDRYEYARPMPWLGDVARIERAWLDSYHAADRKPLAATSLAAVPADRLADVIFQMHPATRIVRSRYAAVTIFAANRASAAPPAIDAGEAEDALITRPQLEVTVRHLPPGGAAFLQSLSAAMPLGAAAAAALEACPSFDLGAAIAGMLEAGAFTAIALGDPS
ncbi:MAG: putative DNA-binding domain-containing protein [Hyphomicrobiales bacterium]|nr:putative DNA-binding domain-containing protein [Hyphomicrobiales bacterium]